MRHDRDNDAIYNPQRIRNISIISHVDHGKTTLSDHLLVIGGMLPINLAGKLRALDYLEAEQIRGITIEDSISTFEFEYMAKIYTVNLIDTPGHIDFSSKVEDALRLVDNGIIIVDAVEGIMAQTITVIQQGVKENLELVLYINKIDKLIQELEMSIEEIRARVERIIGEIHAYFLEFGYQSEIPSFANERVILGSALHGWAIDLGVANEIGGFQTILDWYNSDLKIPNIAKTSTVFERTIVEKLYPPTQSDKLKRILSDEGNDQKDFILNENEHVLLLTGKKYRANRGKELGILTRIFAGHIEIGDNLYSNIQKEWVTIEKVNFFRGERKIDKKIAHFGEIIGIQLSKSVFTGDVLTSFETNNIQIHRMNYLLEPVVFVSIEPRNYNEIESLVDELNIMCELQPNLSLEESKETGELIISGIGTLQIDILINDLMEIGFDLMVGDPQIIHYYKVDQNQSSIVQYDHLSLEFLPNTRNTQNTMHLLYEDQYQNMLFCEKELDTVEKKAVIEVYRTMIISPGQSNHKLRECQLLIREAFSSTSLTYEQTLIACNKLFRKLLADVKLSIYEPVHELKIELISEDYIGSVSGIVNLYGGMVHEINKIPPPKMSAELPVANTADFANTLRKETFGRVYWTIKDVKYRKK